MLIPQGWEGGGGGGWRGETYTPHYHNYTPRRTTADYHTDEHVYYSWSTLIINVLLCTGGQRKSNRWCQHQHHTEPHPDQFTLRCYSTPDKMQGTWKIHCPRRQRTSNGWANTTTQNHIQINSPYAAIVLKTKCREPKKYIVLGDREQATDGPTPPHRSTSRSIHLVLLKTKCRGPEKYIVLGDRQQQLVPTPPPPHRSTSRSIHLTLLKTKCGGPEKYTVLVEVHLKNGYT